MPSHGSVRTATSEPGRRSPRADGPLADHNGQRRLEVIVTNTFSDSPWDHGPFPLPLQITDVLTEATGRCDWRKVRAIYKQSTQLAENNTEPALLWQVRATLSEVLAQIASSYDAHPAELAVHTLAQFADIDGHELLDSSTFKTIYLDKRFRFPPAPSGQRRRPSPYEAVVETCRRLRDANAISQAMSGTRTSGILCGSANYGQFYGVRGNVIRQVASDLDLVIATSPDTDLVDMAKRLGTVPGISTADVTRFLKRVRVFINRYDSGRTTLSHKFVMWGPGQEDRLLFGAGIGADYLLSIHVVPPTVLEYALVESSTSLLEETAGMRRLIRDYRDRVTDRDDELHGFDGRLCTLKSQPTPATEGVLRRTCAYYIDESDHYFPGFYQVITQPKLNLCWDEAKVHARFDQFKRKLADRLRYERQREPFADMRPSYAHLRLGLFAPHVIRQLDSDYSPN